MQNRKGILLAIVILGAGLAIRPAATGATHHKSKPKLTRSDIEKMLTSLSNWGRWGSEDERGALNLITPQKRRQAAALVREGVSFSLARNVSKVRSDGSDPFRHKTTLWKAGEGIGGSSDEYSVSYHGYAHTHMDALCHFAYQGKLYNGFSLDEVTEKGAGKVSVITAKDGIFTRGVLMDIPRLLGETYLTGSRAIYPEDLDAWEKKAGLKVESGDAVLIYTGRWARRRAEGEWEIEKNSSGLHASCLPWLKQRDVAIVGSDLALDALPSGVEGVGYPVHLVSIVAMGMPILDNLEMENLSREAAARKRWSFLLTVAPLAVEGGTGSPLNPIALF